MAMLRQEGDLVVIGNISAQSFTLPNSTITNAMIASAADLSASKLEHQFHANYTQPNTTATSVTQVIHRVYGATAQVLAIHAGSIVACIGAATVTVDLKKNGSSILSAVITLDSSNAAYTGEAGTVTSPSLVAGDVLTIVTVATAGGGTIATGLYVDVTMTEKAA